MPVQTASMCCLAGQGLSPVGNQPVESRVSSVGSVEFWLGRSPAVRLGLRVRAPSSPSR